MLTEAFSKRWRDCLCLLFGVNTSLVFSTTEMRHSEALVQTKISLVSWLRILKMKEIDALQCPDELTARSISFEFAVLCVAGGLWFASIAVCFQCQHHPASYFHLQGSPVLHDQIKIKDQAENIFARFASACRAMVVWSCCFRRQIREKASLTSDLTTKVAKQTKERLLVASDCRTQD